MARDERRRQKALARKKARKQARRTSQARSSAFQSAMDGVSKTAIRSSPIHECLCWEPLSEAGFGYAVVARRVPTGEVVTGLFMVDMFCLGVKDSIFKVFSGLHEYEELKDKLGEHVPLKSVSAPYIRKLVEGAVAYARDLGFEPARNYRATAEVFGDINAAECDETFVFGKDGRPFYMRGPEENAIRARQIVEQLTQRCGPDGFDFLMTPPEDDDSDYDDDDIFGDDEELVEDSEIIPDGILDTTPSKPVFGQAPVPEPQVKPKGFFSRLFRR